MNKDTAMDILISRYVNGESTDEELQKIRDRLARDTSFARVIYRQAFREQELRDFYAAGVGESALPADGGGGFRIGRWIPLAAAAAVLVAVGIWRLAGDRGAGARPSSARTYSSGERLLAKRSPGR